MMGLKKHLLTFIFVLLMTDTHSVLQKKSWVNVP